MLILKITIYFKILFISLINLNSDYTIIQLICFLLIGLITAHGIQLIHEIVHISVKKNQWNFFGEALGILTLTPYKIYKNNHLRHHRYLGTMKDRDFFDFHLLRKQSNLFDTIKLIWVNFKDLKSHTITSLTTSLIVYLILGFSLDNNYLVIFILSAYFLITKPAHFLIEIPEHFDCHRDNRNKKFNSRSIQNSIFLIKWFTNWNHLHREHHWNPSVAPEKLIYSDDLKSKYDFKNYLDFYSYFINQISKGVKNDSFF